MLDGMTTPDLSAFSELRETALAAYRTDSSYAEEIARQANVLRSRQEAKKEKVGN